MKTLANFFNDASRTSAIAGLATTLAAAAAGKAEGQSAVAPINAISHILFGDKAAREEDTSLQYTASGIALNGVAVASWAAVYEALFGERIEKGSPMEPFVAGAVISGLAYLTDYYIVPRRLTPGFEKRLGSKSLFAVYATLALSLGLGGYLRSKR